MRAIYVLAYSIFQADTAYITTYESSVYNILTAWSHWSAVLTAFVVQVSNAKLNQCLDVAMFSSSKNKTFHAPIVTDNFVTITDICGFGFSSIGSVSVLD